MSIAAKSAMVFAKIQPTGTFVDAAATSWMEAIDPKIDVMEAETIALDLSGYNFGSGISYLKGKKSKLSFSVALQGSGTAGTAPAWGVMERICGYAEIITAGTDVKYIPASGAFEKGSISVFIGDTLHRIKSARGNSKISLSTGGWLLRTYEIEGIYVEAITGTAALLTMRDSVKIKPRIDPLAATATNTVTSFHGQAICLHQLNVDTGNAVKTVDFLGPDDCRESLIIDRKSSGDIEFVAPELSVHNWFEKVDNATIGSLSTTLGGVAGKRVNLYAPKVQLLKHSYGDVDGILTHKFNLNLMSDLNQNDTITSEITLKAF